MSIESFAELGPGGSLVGSLASKKAKSVALSYPLSGGNEYAGKLVFHIVDEEAEKPAAITFLDANPSSSTKQAQIDDFAELGTATAVDDFAELNTNAAVTAKARLASTETASALVKATDVSKEPKLIAGRKVSLYLPQALQIQDAAAYDTNFELGRLGGAAEAAMGAQNASVENIFREFGSGISDMAKAVMNGNVTKEQARLAAQQLSRFIPGTGIPTLASGVLGFASNPNVRALFRTVPLRNFSFTFSMLPTSPEEAEEINSIIKFFRTELYPESLSTGNVAIGYKFPNRFVIRAQYKDSNIQGIKFLPMYLQAINTVYNPSGMGMHSDGNFSEYTLTLSFTEAKALSRQDVELGGY